MLLETIEDVYVRELRNQYTGYLSVSTRNILDHLLRRYSKITTANLDHNKKQMDDPYDPSDPIDTYFKRIDNAVQFASDGDIPFTQKQIMQTAYHAIFATGLYVDACKIWRNKPEHEKTWNALKTYFAQEYHELREQNRITAQQTGYHSAGNAEIHLAYVTMDITDALDNLALATTNDCNIIAQLTEANEALTRANLTLTEQIKELIQAMSSHDMQTTEKNDQKRTKVKRFEEKLDPNGYCWTHGYKVSKGHSSHTCSSRAKGHQVEATRSDTMGGSDKNKEWKTLN